MPSNLGMAGLHKIASFRCHLTHPVAQNALFSLCMFLHSYYILTVSGFDNLQAYTSVWSEVFKTEAGQKTLN